jgi:hypothetical protein
MFAVYASSSFVSFNHHVLLVKFSFSTLLAVPYRLSGCASGIPYSAVLLASSNLQVRVAVLAVPLSSCALYLAVYMQHFCSTHHPVVLLAALIL